MTTPDDRCPHTEATIISACVRSLFPPRRWAVCPNASWGLGLRDEVDLLAVSKAGSVHFVEVKISVADFRRDQRKHGRWLHTSLALDRDWREAIPESNLCRCFWFAVPDAMRAVVVAEAPVCAGIIEVYANSYGQHLARVIRQPRRLNCLKPARDLRPRLWRLAAMRYWAAELARDKRTLRRDLP